MQILISLLMFQIYRYFMKQTHLRFFHYRGDRKQGSSVSYTLKFIRLLKKYYLAMKVSSKNEHNIETIYYEKMSNSPDP